MKPRNFIIGALLVVFGSVAAGNAQPYGRGQSSVNPGLVARAQQVTGDRFTVATTTPRGVTVVARVAPRPEVLRAIDAGFADLFAAAARHGYRAALNFRDYTVFIGRADRTRDSSGQYSPDIAVGAGQYRGSVYDQGGYVFAAGMVLSNNPLAFVIAEHERDWQRISNVVRYEGEHLILYHNDRRLYAQTADHSRGGSHPIFQ
ncbi:MAG TPA: hypothetical protein VJS64_01165 [Pyrinomonadaceae bacterium]|nr:hypothetical protein [Pyrinomonadaceae bacterium]